MRDEEENEREIEKEIDEAFGFKSEHLMVVVEENDPSRETEKFEEMRKI
jgi:predicted RND superfamily exporter protein